MLKYKTVSDLAYVFPELLVLIPPLQPFSSDGSRRQPVAPRLRTGSLQLNEPCLAVNVRRYTNLGSNCPCLRLNWAIR